MRNRINPLAGFALVTREADRQEHGCLDEQSGIEKRFDSQRGHQYGCDGQPRESGDGRSAGKPPG